MRAAASPSEKRAAVVRRGTEREMRDLFATRPPDLGSIKQTILPAAGTASRNETSCLFTVAELRDNDRMSAMTEQNAPTAAADDDGVIDLMALSSRPPPPRATVNPLFGGPVSEPPSGFARELSASSPTLSPHHAVTKHKTVIMIAAAALVSLIAGTIGVSAVFSGDAGAPKRASAWMHLPAPKLAAARAPVASDPEENQSTADGAKSAKKAKKGAAIATYTKGGGTTTSKYVPPPRAPKPADTCGCKGDFNCILRCTAKGK